MKTVELRRMGRPEERRFYLGFLILITFAVLFGFSRTFFLKRWFPEWAAAHGAPEPFFFFHGVVFFAWFLLLLVQAALITVRRVHVHRRLGWVGAGLAVVMVVVGVAGSLIAARRPTGFMDVPVPPLQFLAIPLVDIALFGAFVAMAILTRRAVQSHKRFMLLASIALLDAAVVRWPFSIMTATMPVTWFTMTDLFVDLFLVPMIIWDIISRGRLHPVTLWGGLALIASQPFRMLLSETNIWLTFAGWAVSLLGQ